MKKILFIAIILVAALSSSTLNAQVKWGFKMGADFSNLKIDILGIDANDALKTKRLITPRLGFIIEVPVNDEFFFQTGVFGAMKGIKFDSERVVDNESVSSKEYEVILCMDFPINFGYKYDLGGAKLFAMVGPVISYNTYSTLLYQTDGKDWNNEHQTIGTLETDTYKPLNFGVNLEGGIEVSRFQFTAFYTQGLSNLSNHEETTTKTNVFGLTAAVKFGRVDNRRGGYRR
jgi:hypothetical protein